MYEGYLPGGVRTAAGPASIVAELAATYRAGLQVERCSGTNRDWGIRLRASDGTRIARYHIVAQRDGLIINHWEYSEAANALTEGFSGSAIRRVERPDGSVVYEKRISPTRDWLLRVTRDRRGREAALWVDGPLRNLPDCLDYPVLDVVADGDGWLITLRDVSAALVSAASPSIAQWREAVTCLAQLHERYEGSPPRGLCSMGHRLGLFSPRVALAEIGGADLLPKMSLHGWRVAPDLLPDDVRGPILDLARHPTRLIAALAAAAPLTLIHGDANGNLGFEGGRVVALDWGLACRAPAELEFAWMLSWTTERDALLDQIRTVLGPRRPGPALRLALLMNILFWLPNLAYLIRTGTPEDAAGYRLELDWWVAQARAGLTALGA